MKNLGEFVSSYFEKSVVSNMFSTNKNILPPAQNYSIYSFDLQFLVGSVKSHICTFILPYSALEVEYKRPLAWRGLEEVLKML